MKPTEVLREVLYPLTDLAILLAMLLFLALSALVSAAGLFGIWLAVILVPAFFRYALYVLEARAHGRAAEPPGGELFNWVENNWSLFPLLLLLICGWLLGLVAHRVSLAAALLLAAVLCTLIPASMGILGLSHSPLQSLNPLALQRVMAACGRQYFWIPAVLLLAVAGVLLLDRAGAPTIVVSAAAIYAYFVLFSLTGAVLHSREMTARVDIPEALQASDAVLGQRLQVERKKVAGHAYGFVSRGNRAGGLRHIERWIAREDDAGVAYEWFFRELLGWENTDAALFLAQDYLQRLLAEERDIAAIKLISRCLLEDATFRPLTGDGQAVLQLLERHGRDDLIGQLDLR